jgi:RNA polymerase sigma-70 factor (ECF subfamily)
MATCPTKSCGILGSSGPRKVDGPLPGPTPVNWAVPENAGEAAPPAQPPAPSDEELLDEFAAGDRQALEHLFARHRQPAYRVAHRLLGNEADALDAVQEGFVKALTHLDGFQGRSSFKTWLLRVVSNAALDLGRQRGRRELVSLDAVRHTGEALLSSLLSADESARGLEREDLRFLIDQALATLSEVQRQTFVLYADAGLSYREVAEVTNTSVGTVMSRLFYARQKLRAYLTQRLEP